MCDNVNTLRVFLILNNLFKISCVLIPIILIITGIITFSKAVIGNEQDEIKKSFTQLIKKIIAGLIVLILPTIISFFINLAGDYSTIQICLDNATIENVKYYEKIDPLMTEISDLLANPTETSLNRVKKMYEENKDSLKADTITSIITDLDLAEIKVNAVKLMQECRNKGGIYQKGYCTLPQIIKKPTSQENQGQGNSDNSNYVEPNGGNGTVDINVSGTTYSVVNTPGGGVQSFQSFLISRGVAENSNLERYSDYCLGFAYTQGYALYVNDRSINAEDGHAYKYAGKFTTYINDSKEDILSKVYNEVSSGRPVILQVNGNKKGTSRHFVTVVGYKQGVTSSTIQETDLLIIDSYDAKLERMDTSSSRFMTSGADCHKDYSGYRIQYLKQG